MGLIDLLKDPEALARETGMLVLYSPELISGLYSQWTKHVHKKGYSTIEEKAKEIKGSTGQGKINIIGYSLGGLVGLAYAMEQPEKVGKCMFIGTPFGGVPVAYLSFILLGIGVNPNSAMQMTPGSSFLRALRAYFNAHNDEFRRKGLTFENICSTHDEFVPDENGSLNALCPGAENITERRLSKEGHGALLHCETTKRHIARFICESDLPTFCVPGFGLNGRMFKQLTSELGKSGLISGEDMKKVVPMYYDYTKPIKADKIMGWYDENR
ncbi:MAG TPA: alpha/beta fold hydrolase [Nanoarchaeota archaeon]|nr:alpha/beta fold hydrolase [Nanoarchaeota archaeon]